MVKIRPRKAVEAVEDGAHDGDDDQQRQHLDAAQVELVGMASQKLLHAFAEGQAHAGARAQMRCAFPDQVIAHMRSSPSQAGIGRRPAAGILCQLQREMGNLQLGTVGMFGVVSDAMAIKLAARIIHASVGLGWVLRQHRLEDD